MSGFMSPEEDMMDFIQDNEEEDRISNLPDDIIHHIFSFIDTENAVQTSTLSRKWRNIWTSSPYLNLNNCSEIFGTPPQFATFVDFVLRSRDNCAGVSALQLQLLRPAHIIFEEIIKYVYSRKVGRLVMKWNSDEFHELPNFLFSCHTLKQLTLDCLTSTHHLPKSAWDFPALVTLNLCGMYFHDTGVKSLDLFNKCVNLKDLMLSRFSLSGLDSFNICCPKLSNLTIKDAFGFPNVFNVNAPHLKNIIASVAATTDIGNGPTSFLHLSTESFNILEKVDLSLQFHRSPCADMKQFVPMLFKLFQDLHSAKFLFLNTEIIEVLSWCSDQLFSKPCPFDYLKSLKVHNMEYDQGGYLSPMVTQIRNCWLKDCPSATPGGGGSSVVGKRGTRLYEPEERLHSSSRGVKTESFCSASRNAFIMDDVLDICLPLSKKLRIT